MSESCTHDVTVCYAQVIRLTETDGGPITAYCAEVTIRCKDCGEPFIFLGLPMGSSPLRPTVSVDGTELRVPLMASGAKTPPMGKIND